VVAAHGLGGLAKQLRSLRVRLREGGTVTAITDQLEQMGFLAEEAVIDAGALRWYGPSAVGELSREESRVIAARVVPVFGAAHALSPSDVEAASALVADADGRNVLQLSASGGAPAWSPDGTRIAFRSERYSWKGTWKPGVVQHPFFDIYTIRPDGTELVRLTSDEVSLNPEWSPDGRIWFIKVINPLNGDEPAQFWVMDADGSHATQTNPPPEQAWFLQPTP